MIQSKTTQRSRTNISRQVGGFTLIELLVVIALTTILLTVLFVPLIQAFHFTEQAQATTQAQDAARLVTEQLTRELGNAAAVRDTTGNYIDLPLLNQNGQEIIAHGYNAYIDIVPPRPAPGTVVDPTIDPNSKTVTIGGQSLTGVSSELTATGPGLPLAAGSTIIRYFIGLRYPIDPAYIPGSTPDNVSDTNYAKPADPQPYSNRFDGLNVAATDAHASSYVKQQGLNNTYQLYRANIQPYIIKTTGANAGTAAPNTLLFPVGVSTPTVPIIDDPDFFRIVRIGDPDQVADQGDNGTYTAATAGAHNDRVYNWVKLAKTVISTHDIDLVGLPRIGGKIVYDSKKNPVDAYEQPNASGTVYPIVRTSVNFAPALISNDPMSASNTSDIAQGYGESPSDGTLPYIPSLFQSQYGNWQGTPSISITKAVAGSSPVYYQTSTFTTADASSNYTLGLPNYSTGPVQTTPAVGDYILASSTATGQVGTPVYDITAGAPIVTGGTATPPTYDAMMYDKNRGVIDFSLPALPPSGNNALNTYFTVPPTTLTTALTGFNQYSGQPFAYELNLGDFVLFPNTPLPAPTTETGTNPSVVPNATLVVNSERVVGPDLAGDLVPSSGTTSTDMVQYTKVANIPTRPNEYSINYATNTISFGTYVPSTVQVAFNYQNNLSSSGATYSIDTIRASYYTSAILRLNLGIRVYAAATGYSQYFSLNSQVGVGNAKAN